MADDLDVPSGRMCWPAVGMSSLSSQLSRACLSCRDHLVSGSYSPWQLSSGDRSKQASIERPGHLHAVQHNLDRLFTLELPTSMEPTSQLNFFPCSILLLSLSFGLYLELCTLTISLHLPPENTTCNRKLTDTQGYRRACFRSRDISLFLFLPKRQ